MSKKSKKITVILNPQGSSTNPKGCQRKLPTGNGVKQITKNGIKMSVLKGLPKSYKNTYIV